MSITLTGAIIAGGKSRRMGQDKRLLPIEGVPMLVRVLNRLKPITTSQIIIANDAPNLREVVPPDVPIIPDDILGAGALGGVLTALTHSPSDWVVCVGADMPFINPTVIQAMTALIDDRTEVVLPIVADRPQSLHALYRTTVADAIRTQIVTGNLRLTDLFARLTVRRVQADALRQHDPTLSSFANLNTPEDVRRHFPP